MLMVLSGTKNRDALACRPANLASAAECTWSGVNPDHADRERDLPVETQRLGIESASLGCLEKSSQRSTATHPTLQLA
jgi:hypothetical protein